MLFCPFFQSGWELDEKNGHPCDLIPDPIQTVRRCAHQNENCWRIRLDPTPFDPLSMRMESLRHVSWAIAVGVAAQIYCSCSRHPQDPVIACRITEMTLGKGGERVDIGEMLVFRKWTYIENYT